MRLRAASEDPGGEVRPEASVRRAAGSIARDRDDHGAIERRGSPLRVLTGLADERVREAAARRRRPDPTTHAAYAVVAQPAGAAGFTSVACWPGVEREIDESELDNQANSSRNWRPLRRSGARTEI